MSKYCPVCEREYLDSYLFCPICGEKNIDIALKDFLCIQTDILIDAIKSFGAKNQSIKSVEEMSELTKELLKYEDYERFYDDISNITEEIADVLIMIKQLMLMFDNEPEVRKMIHEKTNRLKLRINERRLVYE